MTHDMTPDIERVNPNDPLVRAATAESEFAAQTKAAVLQDEDIDAFVFPAERSWTGGIGIAPSGGGVPVWVKRSDLERAQDALKQRVADSVDLDWDDVDVGEPEGVNAGSSPTSKAALKTIVRLGWVVAAAIIVLMLFAFGRSLF